MRAARTPATLSESKIAELRARFREQALVDRFELYGNSIDFYNPDGAVSSPSHPRPFLAKVFYDEKSVEF